MPTRDPALRRSRQREYQRKWYGKNSNKVQQDRKVKQLRRKSVDWVAALKTGPCTDCHQSFDPVCMDFDHLPGTEKYDDVAVMAQSCCSKAKILAEIAKCELVCANCHRLRTKLRTVG